jgi:coenzyme PQQ precursor peptide PqqA
MQWTRPDFEEITLCMEVTAYVNTDDHRQPGRNDQIPNPKHQTNSKSQEANPHR